MTYYTPCPSTTLARFFLKNKIKLQRNSAYKWHIARIYSENSLKMWVLCVKILVKLYKLLTIHKDYLGEIKVCRRNLWRKKIEMYFSCKHFYNLVTTSNTHTEVIHSAQIYVAPTLLLLTQ